MLPTQEDAMAPTVTPTNATLGAVVTGLALAHMDEPTWTAVERAFLEHAVLIFPGQHLTEAEQVAFARRFGDIELLAADPELKAVAISNVKPDGTIMEAAEHRYKSLRGNEGWHTDSSYSVKTGNLKVRIELSQFEQLQRGLMRSARLLALASLASAVVIGGAIVTVLRQRPKE
jgi:hypothetical protein